MVFNAPFTRILDILQSYNQVTIEFLADQMSTSRKSIEKYLELLEDDGIVQREGSIVRLVESSKRKKNTA